MTRESFRLTTGDFLVHPNDVEALWGRQPKEFDLPSRRAELTRRITDDILAVQQLAVQHLARLTDGHPDPLVSSGDHPEAPDGWWGVRAFTRKSAPLWLRTLVMGSDTLDNHVQTHAFTTLWCHPSREFVGEVVRQVVDKERGIFVRVPGFRPALRPRVDDRINADTSHYFNQWSMRTPYRVEIIRVERGALVMEDRRIHPGAWMTRLDSSGNPVDDDDKWYPLNAS